MKTDTSTASYEKVKGTKGITGTKSSIESGQRKGSTESGNPGMQDTTPRESDKNQSAP